MGTGPLFCDLPPCLGHLLQNSTVALRVGSYPALSGQRLRAELDLMAGERRGFAGLERLLEWNAFRLWDRDFRTSPASVRHVRAAAQLSRWSSRSKIEIDVTELAVIALLVDQRTDVVTRCLARLALTGERAARLRCAARGDADSCIG